MTTAADRFATLMSGLSSELQTYNSVLNSSCHKRIGISMTMFRLLKLAVNALGLVVAWGMVDAGADPTFGLAVVFVIFGGGEIVETYLAEAGFQDFRRSRSDTPPEDDD